MNSSLKPKRIKLFILYTIAFRLLSYFTFLLKWLHVLPFYNPLETTLPKSSKFGFGCFLKRGLLKPNFIYDLLNKIAHRHHELAEINKSSFLFEYAEALRLETLSLSSKVREPSTILTFFGDGLTTSIGHMSLNISLRVKLQKLFPEIYPFNHELIYSNTTQNEKYLHLYSKYFKLVKLDYEYAREKEKKLWYRHESYTALWTPEGSMNSWKANDRYTRIFEQSFKDPILALDQETIEAGYKFLAQFGFNQSDWFVTLHVRSSKFGPGTGHKGLAYGRNASIDDYFTSIDYITKLGGWVVRIGDNGSPKPLQLPNVIDYTNSQIQNDKVHCFLMARCKFMIGTNSGPINVPSTFGRPVIVTNSPSLCRNTYFPKSIFVPKLVMNKHNRILSLEESFNLKHGFSEFLLNEKKGYHWKNNTPDDILYSVIEMNTRQTDGLTLHQIEFDRIVRDLGTDAIGTISNSFLENHIQELNFT